MPILWALLLLVLFLGVLYGLFMTKAMKRLTAAVKEISDRSYLPVQEPGLFRDLKGCSRYAGRGNQSAMTGCGHRRTKCVRNG
ncbi:MAG: hypothetical protein ACLTBV_20580 [Enterocloster bolteae]